jgi:SAM-dependent methyltransferase
MSSAIDFSKRSDRTEWLDEANLDPVELEKVLHDLAIFNNTFLGHYPIVRWLSRAVRTVPRGTPLTLVDIGCGYGDLLRAIRRWARRRSVDLRLIGIDLNLETIPIAQKATDRADRIEYRAMNAFDLASGGPVDFVVSSLVAHHLSNREITDLLLLMDNVARRGWAICDLQRNRFLYHFIGLSGRIAPFHPMVGHDGQISVTRSLSMREWRQRISDAGLSPADAKIRWFLFRFLSSRLR